jgi:hypothetical protein
MMGPDEKIERLVRPGIRALSAYHVPPANNMVKLIAVNAVSVICMHNSMPAVHTNTDTGAI